MSNGMTPPEQRNGPRVDESRARTVMAFVQKTDERIMAQQAASGSEAAIRKLFAGLASGKPDYDSMIPRLADLARENLSGFQSFIGNLGALKNLTFRKVAENGDDEYVADFEKGALRITMGLDESGRIAQVYFVPR